MARQGQRIAFDSVGELVTHLDQWASLRLRSPEQWEDALVSSVAWSDYSARNQLLLASYGAEGPVAGQETWRLVPSTHEGRSCAVRAGEHGYPVRVPITVPGTEPDPHLGGSRPTRASVERWEWRPVFDVTQLARRPAPDALRPVELPAPLDDTAFLAVAQRVATSTVRGRLRAGDDPVEILARAAERLPRNAKRPPLDDGLARQAAWLVTDRVGLAPTDHPPAFDPERLHPRERWERLQDVLDPARRLTAALGVKLGVDLVASPLPRMALEEDRAVAAGRRNRLPASSLERLPIGRWESVGPYSSGEWAARGEDGSGLGAYLRLNRRAYLVAVETGDGAAWRLEDVEERTGAGQLITGSSASLEEAKGDALATVTDRYPALAPEIGPGGGTDRGQWQPMSGQGQTSAEVRHLGSEVTLYVMPGPGGRWMPTVHVTSSSEMERLPLTRTIDEARDAAELAGRRALRAIPTLTPPVEELVVALASSELYSRDELASLVSSRLDRTEQDMLLSNDPIALVAALGEAGLDARPIVAVLRAEQIDTGQVAAILPTLGLPTVESIDLLTEGWGVARLRAAEALGATASEMREAGCTTREIMASRPRDVLRSLPEDAHLWELAAITMTNAGHDPTTVVSHLVGHAPTPDAFAAGLTAAVESPVEGLGLASQRQASVEQLAATSLAYGLSPATTGHVLVEAGVSTGDLLDVLKGRGDGDIAAVAATGAAVGIDPAEITVWQTAHQTPVTLTDPPGTLLGPAETQALLASLPPPGVAPSPAPDLVDGLEANW